MADQQPTIQATPAPELKMVRDALNKADAAWRYSPSGTGVPAAVAAFLRQAADVRNAC